MYDLWVNKCVRLVTRETIQIQCMRADSDAHPMPGSNAQTEGECIGEASILVQVTFIHDIKTS